MKKYIYPQLSKFDFLVIRSPGPGLGNLLFPLMRALVFSRDTDSVFVEPAIAQIKFGTFFRKERDKRIYAGVLKRRSFTGLMRVFYFWLLRAIGSKRAVIIKGNGDFFYCLCHFKNEIREWLRNRSAYRNTECYDIAVHIRQGDFANFNQGEAIGNGLVNTRNEIDWYEEVLSSIMQQHEGRPRIVFFTDDDTNLYDLAERYGAKFDTSKNALHAILKMSEARIIVGSNSTFSLWATFLSTPDSVSYYNRSFDVSKYIPEGCKQIKLH